MYQISNGDHRVLMMALRHLRYNSSMTLKEENEVRQVRNVLKKLARKKPI